MVLLADQSPGPLLIDIVNSIRKGGDDVTLFSGLLNHVPPEKTRGLRIVRGIAYKRNSLLLRTMTWSIFTIQYLFFLFFCRRPTVILSVTNPPFLTFVTGFVASIRKIPYCILVYDLYPDALIQAELGKADSLLFRIWKRLNKRYFNKAEIVFTISNTMKREISKYCESSRIQVIHNWADTDYIKPLPRNTNRLVRQYDLAQKRVVLYAGNCGLTHDLESLIEAASLLQAVENIVFIIAGEGAKKSKLQKMSRELALRNVIFLPHQSEADFPYLMASADIGVVTLGVGTEAISVPSKTYTTLAAGLCLLAIAHPTSELGEIVARYNVGILCAPRQPRQVAEYVKKILADEAMLALYKQNSLKAVSNFTSLNADLYSKELRRFK